MKGFARWQPYIFTLGMSGVALFMMGAGTLGVPRRHWDITMAGSSLPYEFPATAFNLMGFNGISAVIAGVGGGLFVLIIVGSLLFGKNLGDQKSAQPMIAEPVTSYEGVGSGGMSIPGTFVLALIFLTVFVLYYFINWKYLGQTWGLS